MTKYMKNAGLLRDMMKMSPDLTFDMIEDAFVEAGFDDVYNAKRVFGECADTITEEGMEMCIVSRAREASEKLSLSSGLSRPGEEFNNRIAYILTEIDKGVGFIEDMWWK